MKHLFEGKNFSLEVLELINNAIDEFDELFGQYVSRDEFVKRIEENLDEFVLAEELEGDTVGYYNAKDKKIVIKQDSDIEEIKETVFHELIHCITADGKNCGFKRDYDYNGINIFMGYGLNEGTAEYLTKIRNAKFYKGQYYGISYPILTEQTENLIEIIGKDEFLNTFFNSPDGILDINTNSNIAFDDILQDFDTIWKNEKESLKNRRFKNSIFRTFSSTSMNKQYLQSTQHLISYFMDATLSKEVSSVEELTKIWEKITKWSQQLDTDLDMNIIDTLFEKTNALVTDNLTIDDIKSELPIELCDIINAKEKLIEFEGKSIQQKLEELQPGSEIENIICTENLASNSFKNKIIQMLYMNHILESDINNDFAFDLSYGISNFILDGGYNFYDLSFEKLKTDDLDNIYIVYQGASENKQQIAVLCQSPEDDEMIFSKMTEVSNFEDIKTFMDDSGELTLLASPGYYTLSYSDGYTTNLKSVSNIPSVREYLLNNIEKTKSYISKYRKMGVPDFIIQKDLDKLEAFQKDLDEIMSTQKITPQDIEKATIENGTSLSDVENGFMSFIKSLQKDTSKKSSEEFDYDNK